MNQNPLGDRLIVKPLPVEKQINGVHMPDTIATRPIEGDVVKVGPLVHWCKVGDRVTYAKYGGSDIKIDIDGEPTDVVIIREDDILSTSGDIAPTLTAPVGDVVSATTSFTLNFAVDGTCDKTAFAQAVTDALVKATGAAGVTMTTARAVPHEWR